MANNEKTGTLNRIRVVLAEQEKTNRWLARRVIALSICQKGYTL